VGLEESKADFTRDPPLKGSHYKLFVIPITTTTLASTCLSSLSSNPLQSVYAMGLVDYGSDSDSDSPPQSTAPAPAPVPPTRSKRRILLDLPAPSATTPNAQAGPSSSKRFKSDSGDPSPPLTGLAAMLPKPKNSSSAPSAPVAPPKVAAKGPSRLEVLLAGADKAPKANEAALLLPPAVAAKRKQEQAPPPADFFGISELGVPPPAP
jgi:hypothetical protein